MNNIAKYLLVIMLFFFGCNREPEIVQRGKHYQKHQDYKSLNRVVELMPLEVDTIYEKSILGEPIDMGFDYRF